MSHIPRVGRKTWSIRLLIAGLYFVLILGAATMIYPFLVMLSTSVKSGVDVHHYAIIPAYVLDTRVLFAKYAETKFAGDVELVNESYATQFAKLEDILPPQDEPLSPEQMTLVQDWHEFSTTLPSKHKQAGFRPVPGTAFAPSRLLDEYRQFLRERFDNDIDKLNSLYLEENTSFEQVFSPYERIARREWQPDDSPKMQEWIKFVETLPHEFHRVIGCDALFASFLREDVYDRDIGRLNAAYGTDFEEFTDVHLSPTLPDNPAERADWEKFARTMLPFRFMELSHEAVPAYRSFLSQRYRGDISEVNRIYETEHASFSRIALPETPPAEGTPLIDWMEFIQERIPISAIRVANAENLFRQYVLETYGDLEEVNSAYGMQMASISELSLPDYLADWSYVLDNDGALKRHFLTRNYVLVLNYMLLHGRAVFNTVVFCLAVILTALIVNPLCAYALSRYSLRYAYKILLFLLATMAFPAEVTLIPNFLLLKELNMLNTFWALVLPGMASGFSIFLLKGFFDSLPRELYEAGIIDGASELKMFWKITIPLSKPIFAVIALQSFVGAYGAFMFAFLVCQDPNMWTMMVWLYQLQITAPKFITMAALTVAAIPTLLVFVFCQNVIMRGIILPSYK